MDSENKKKVLVRIPNGQEVIELTEEDLKEYSNCLDSKKFTNRVLSLAGAIFTSIATPVQASSNLKYYLKKGLAGTVALSFFSILTDLGSALACGPILQKSVKLKKGTIPAGQTDEPSTKELSDFTPSIFSDDFSSSINISSDTSGIDRVVDKQEDSQDLRSKPVKKRVTYDELWRLHQENSQARNKAKDKSSSGTDLEYIMENEPSLEKKKIRTNKYGDPLE